jgi:DNA-directed RNA polymerase subunit M/transcription elongation factor TFIIS
MTTATSKPERERPKYVYVTRPKCPDCGSVKLRAYKTIPNGDLTLTRYCKCGECQARLILVVE